MKQDEKLVFQLGIVDEFIIVINEFFEVVEIVFDEKFVEVVEMFLEEILVEISFEEKLIELIFELVVVE